MNTAKTVIVWWVMVIVFALGTIYAVQALDGPLGLRSTIASFGQPKVTH